MATPPVTTSHQSDRASEKPVPRRFGAWTLDELRYVGNEKVPNKCVITQRSVRIIASSGRVISVELDRAADGSGTGLSDNRLVNSIYLDGIRYWIKHVTSKPEVPITDGPVIDDPVTRVFFYRVKSDLKPIDGLISYFDKHRILRIFGSDGKVISSLKLDRFNELRRICEI
jgi:hypothetical protein